MGEEEERVKKKGDKGNGSEEEHSGSRSQIQRKRELCRVRADFSLDLAISQMV